MEDRSAGMEKILFNLKETVRYLSHFIGERSFQDIKKLDAAAEYIEDRFRDCGYPVKRQPFIYRGGTYYNVVAKAERSRREDDGTLVIGAH